MRRILSHTATFVFLSVAAALSGCGGGSAKTGPPDIVLIIIDTVRPDHMSLHGYDRETTPVIDSLASFGTVWTRVQAQSSWSVPSMASVLTGLSQRSHCAGKKEGMLYGMDPSLPTIPILLSRGARYRSAAFFNSGLLSEAFGFDGGFDHFDCRFHGPKTLYRDAERTVEDYLQWYDTDHDPSRPLFSAIHFFDTHLPYSPPPPWDGAFVEPASDPTFNTDWGRGSDVADLESGRTSMTPDQLEILEGLHDGELAFVDAQIGRLISGLGDRGGLENTVFVITGLHGEEFMERGGFGHGHTMYQELLHVPLIMSGPGIAVSVDHTPAAQYDIFPTLLAMADIEIPIWMDGIDLLSDPPPSGTRYITSRNPLHADHDMACLRTGNHVMMGNPATMQVVLYDLDTDPRQETPLAPSRESVDRFYHQWSLPSRAEPPSVEPTGEIERELYGAGHLY